MSPSPFLVAIVLCVRRSDSLFVSLEVSSEHLQTTTSFAIYVAPAGKFATTNRQSDVGFGQAGTTFAPCCSMTLHLVLTSKVRDDNNSYGDSLYAGHPA